MAHLVDAQNVTMQFGGLKAVNDVTMYIDEAEIVALIGPNGAGKTTFFNMLTGIYTPTQGTLTFKDVVVGGKKPHVITRLGITRTFQNIRLFQNMTALENVMVGRHTRTTEGPVGAVLRSPQFKTEEAATMDHAFDWLKFVGLSQQANELAKNLPYGDQRRLEIARALAAEPTLLLLDEPAAGMNPQESQALNALVRKVRDRGVTILLIEHDMKVVMDLADRIYVLDFGELIAHGTAAEIQRNPKVIEAYLGSGAQAVLEAEQAAEAAAAAGGSENGPAADVAPESADDATATEEGSTDA